jgi:Ribonuclease G/E
MPCASRVGISRKIGERAERSRLREQMKGVLPEKSGGVIVRTVGEDVTRETFERELNTLMAAWGPAQDVTFHEVEPNLFFLQAYYLGGWKRFRGGGTMAFI